MATAHLGTTKRIANVDTEQSQEAKLCRTFYDTARDATLRDFDWPFATKFKNLGLVQELDPNQEWSYSYEYPSDCLKARRVLSGTRNDTRQSRIPYKIFQQDQTQLVYCDVEDAALEYTVVTTDPLFYPADFILALSYRLSVLISPALTKGDPFKMKQDLENLYQKEISRAQASSLNEEQPEEEVLSEFERSR